MRVKVAATLFGLTFAVATCLTAQGTPPAAAPQAVRTRADAARRRTPRRRLRARPAAAARRPRADRTRQNAVRHQLHRLSRRGSPRRRHRRTEPAAVAGCLERPGRRIDRPHHSGQPERRRHARHRHELPPTPRPSPPMCAACWRPSADRALPPSVGQAAPSVLVGNAAEGQAYFAAKCASCHSATGDLKGIATQDLRPQDAAEHLGGRRRTRRPWRTRRGGAGRAQRPHRHRRRHPAVG